MKNLPDRIAEIGIALLAGAVLFLNLPGFSGGTDLTDDLASVRPQEVSVRDRAEFASDLDRARRLVDGNGDPRDALADLRTRFPGVHEVWALSARHREDIGEKHGAVRDYARAVRLYPDYLEDGSPFYVGARVERLADQVFGELRAARSDGGLSDDQRSTLKAVYFLRRRLAGGCE